MSDFGRPQSLVRNTESLKRAWERAVLLLETARQRPNKIRIVGQTNAVQPKWKSIHQKLTDLYIEECAREPKHKHLRNATHLLDKLVAREKIGCVVVNLYAGNEGYSVLLKGRNGMDTETIRLPYEEAELLQYIDNEELPPILVDILECSETNIFHSGCVVAEVRDYRRSTIQNVYESHHVLLKPTTQSLVCDVNSLTSDGSRWSNEDKMALESQLLLATQEPLCLEPSLAVSLVANYLQHSKHKFGVAPIKNMTKRYSQAAVNRKWKFEQHAAPSNLRLYDFIAQRRDKKHSQPAVNLRLGKPSVDAWNRKEVHLSTPSVIDVGQYATTIAPRAAATETSPLLEFVEEYTLTSKQANGKGYHCRLTVHQRTLDEMFLCELYTDRDYVEDELKGTSYQFELGTRANVEKYLQQFTEIFTQESRQAVVIVHQAKGRAPISTTVPCGQVFTLTSASALASSQQPAEATNADSGDEVDTKIQSSGQLDGGVSPASNSVPPGPPASAVPASLSQAASHSPAPRPGSRQASSTPTRPSSVSPGPVNMSPGHVASGAARTRTNPTPPPVHGSRTATGLSPSATAAPSKMTPPYIMSPSPPMQTQRRLQPAVDSSSVQPTVGILSRIHQPGLGFISGDAAMAALAPAGSSVPGLSVATSIAMMTPGHTSLLTTPTGVFVANLVTHPQPGSVSSSSISAMTGTLAATSTVPSTAIMMTTGMTPSPTMVSFPMGITGGLNPQNLTTARFFASNLKGAGVGLQPGSGGSVGLLQVSNSPSPQAIFNPGMTHRGSAMPHAIAPAITPVTRGAASPPALVSFASQQPCSSTALQLSLQQIASLQLQQLHHHQLQQQHHHASNQQSVPAKSKGRKRGGTTPPK